MMPVNPNGNSTTRSYDRICEALRKRRPDRVPIMTLLSPDNFVSKRLDAYVRLRTECEQAMICEMLTYFGFPAVGADVEKEVIPTGDGWNQEIFTAPDGRRYVRTWQYAENALYERYKGHLVTDEAQLEELLAIPYLRPDENPDFIRWIRRASAEISRLEGESAYATVVIQGPLAYLGYNIAPEDLAIWTKTSRKALSTFIKETVRRQAEYLEYLLSCMQEPFILGLGGSEYALPPLMSPDDFDEFVLDADSKLIDVIHQHQRLVYVHCHGKVRDFIPRFIEMGADGLHPLEPPGSTGDCDIREVKSAFGRKLCLIGNIQSDLILRGTPAEVAANVKQTVLAARDDGGFILCPSSPFFQKTLTPAIEDNIVAYVEAGLEYGQY